jgi:hypothetical protein
LSLRIPSRFIRLQLAVAGGVAAVALIVNVTFYDVLGETVANGLIMVGVLTLPAAAGIGIVFMKSTSSSTARSSMAR